MVETEGIELPTPQPVVEPVSDIRVRNGNFRCRDRGAEMGSFAVNARPETTRIREFGRHVFEIAGLSRASLNIYNLRVWVVDTEGIELPTPQPVLETVSYIRVRNG